ncbi:hypothetical protein LMH87_003060 [Akanthomyces muscarius]|uniref:Uncharacterized protein n=1 Tax=Akanthomyces muscarius TaxID=2231603 RepID=A0A9W8UHM9_AKAMU|nr:hypothetical protein LMH87_003060 [Akanthomyces muscarius]KAJ4148596.1 hypothetical protein LMH87_003060 [Akanthomyces muscarius]
MPSRMAAPKYDILLQPRSADGPALSRLQVTITLESRERKLRQLLFCLEPGSLSCTLGRDTVGDVVLVQDVTPKVATVNDKMHAYTEVCCDQGGLIGHRPARAGHGASPKGSADLVHYMTHKMVRNWAYLGGIAEFHALYLLYAQTSWVSSTLVNCSISIL